tara:strand:+ start:343 stop:672 length:330 start_codon:yes stop_codon:yes gene_type:complete
MWKWIKHRLAHKFDHFSVAKIKNFLKENGLAFVVIFVGWEIVEDVVFPIIFGVLGNYVHPAFYAGIPASLILCFHWLAVPILWGAWLKIKKKNSDVEIDCCAHEEEPHD